MTHWTVDLERLGPCQEALDWARTQPTLAAAWQTCERGDWMLWLVGKLSGGPGGDARKRLSLCACDCAETSAHLATPDGQMAIAWCLTITREWAGGGDADIADVRAAADASYAAADAAASAAADASYAAADASYAAADASYAAADAAASAAANAAASAGACAAAHTDMLRQCADIVREHYPEVPRLSSCKESGGEDE